jgi:transcriptional regulator GlxA family with amidase domain
LVQNYGTRRRTSPSAPTQITNVQLQRAKELLRAHLDGRILLEELARECGLSRAHFSRVFKQSTGQTPHGWLTQQRVAASRDLLANASLSLADVARRCGFANQSHFTRVFAKSEGVAPGAWRRSRRMPYRSSPSSPW